VGKRNLNIFLWTITVVLLFTYHWLFSFDNLIRSNIFFAVTNAVLLYQVSWIINLYLVPKLLYKKHFGTFILTLILLFIASCTLMRQAEWVWFTFMKDLSKFSEENFYSFSYQFIHTYMVHFLGCVCICAFRLLSDHWTSQAKYEALQKEKARTELYFLKAQLNPHFLFNLINSLYAEIDKSNTSARNIILKFTDMLRYQLYECNVENIAIEKEVEYLRNYVALEKLRKEDYLRTDFTTKGDLKGFEVAPLLFIPFVENAFKYASNHENKANLISIGLEKDKTYVIFECRNSKDNIVSRNLVEDSGIGISNVKRRLELLYPGKHQLTIENEEEFFQVNLKIKVK
jgi:two-component system, LytTR family, sensor kinase